MVTKESASTRVIQPYHLDGNVNFRKTLKDLQDFKRTQSIDTSLAHTCLYNLVEFTSDADNLPLMAQFKDPVLQSSKLCKNL